MSKTIRIGVLGASGYTGADLVRLALRHPAMEITVLTANTHAGKADGRGVPAFRLSSTCRSWSTIEAADWSKVDAVFCGLPHGTTQEIASAVLAAHPKVKFIDMSADFRLANEETYRQWYGHEHRAPHLQGEAVYGLTEHNRREDRRGAAGRLPRLLPDRRAACADPAGRRPSSIDADDIVIDAKSGVTGAGRSLKQNTLFTEAGEGLSPYSVAQAPPRARDRAGARQAAGRLADRQLHAASHPDEPRRTLHVLCPAGAQGDRRRHPRGRSPRPMPASPSSTSSTKGVLPQTQDVRGSNHVQIGVFADRMPGRAIVISTIDNLVKGSAGQAIQNFNLMFGLDETEGLMQLPLFP